MGWGPDRWRLYGLALREIGRSLRIGLARLVRTPFFFAATTPERLLFAPQDLRTSDPTVASDIYAGYFVFSGRALATGGRSPFDFQPPSNAWGEALYGFGWLRHLRAADTALARANARALIDEFISGRGERRLAQQAHVRARRVISFLTQSPLVLDGADHAFYHRFMRTLGRSIRLLERDAAMSALPHSRLMAAIALCYAGLCCEGFEALRRRATRILARELGQQVMPDGGHLSRNPRVLIELLLDLLPLRQIFLSRSVEPPEDLTGAIDRMLPMLRLFRHGDGTLSHFNGMGLTAADHLATILIYDDARARPMQHAPHTGYERLEAGDTLVVADVGPPPPIEHSREAHAGCLSFELSSGAQRIVINCAAPRGAGEATLLAARSTAAHSTACVAAASSCRFLVVQGWWWERRLAAWLVRRLGNGILSGPRNATAAGGERGDGAALVASHDGYRSRFGITHERHWHLVRNGDALEGDDVFVSEAGGAASHELTIRFHLHPATKASRGPGGGIVLLLPNREAWQFEASGAEARLDESIFFAAPGGVRRTEQIVLTSRSRETPRVRWRFERLTRAPERAARDSGHEAGESDALP